MGRIAKAEINKRRGGSWLDIRGMEGKGRREEEGSRFLCLYRAMSSHWHSPSDPSDKDCSPNQVVLEPDRNSCIFISSWRNNTTSVLLLRCCAQEAEGFQLRYNSSDRRLQTQDTQVRMNRCTPPPHTLTAAGGRRLEPSNSDFQAAISILKSFAEHRSMKNQRRNPQCKCEASCAMP
jgi:hypothetical protein